MELLHHLGFAIGAIGVAIIVWGVALSLVRFLRAEMAGLRGREVGEEKEMLRHQLGYYLLLGLEFLVAADVVHTVLTPDLPQLAILGAIVAIRTVISFSINWELRHGAAHRPK